MKKSTGSTTNTLAKNTYTDLTIDFTTLDMIYLLKAYSSLRKLETLLNMLNGIDRDNRVLIFLRNMDSLLQNLSPLYNEDRDQERTLFNTILADDTIGFIAKARLLMGIREDLELYESHPEQLEKDVVIDMVSMRRDKSGPVISFSVDNMKSLLLAFYGYRCLDDVLGLLNGSSLEHDIIDGLRYLHTVIEGITPLYDMEYDDDEEENKAYAEVMKNFDLGLSDRAWRLMGGEADH